MKGFSIPSFSFSASEKSPQIFKRDNGPKCYAPDGAMIDSVYACNISANVSPCCSIGEICLDNKLCLNGRDLYRGACTDRTWLSSDCPRFCVHTLDPFLLIAICPKNETGGYVSCCPNEVGDDHCSCQDEFVSWRLWEQTPITTIGPTANLTTRHVSRSSTESTSFSLNSFSSTTPNQTNTSLETGVSSSTSVFTLAIGAKAGIGVGIFLGVIIMMIPSFLLWRSKRKNRFSKEKASVQDQITKAEMDADESQRPDYRARELSGDMAHELRGEKDANNRWELLGDEAHELRGEDDANEMWELPGDEAHELRGEHHVHDGCELPGDTAHKVSSSGGRNGIRVEELPGDIVNNGG